MDIDLGALTGLVVIVAGGGVLALSYVAAYMLGQRSAFRRKAARPESLGRGARSTRLERIETAVETIAVEVERLAENQRFLLSKGGGHQSPASGSAVVPQHRRHITPS